MYDLYPGSIVDVVTLKNTLHRVRSLGIKDYTLILDQGFFSQGNLEELINEQLSFVIPASLTIKALKEVLTATQRDLASPQYLWKYQTDPIFVKPVTLRVRDKEIAGFCYYDLQREQDERNLFYLRRHDLKQKLESLQIRRWRKPEEVFRERAGPQRINRMGKQIILVRGSLDWEESLTVYRERDAIEKVFH